MKANELMIGDWVNLRVEEDNFSDNISVTSTDLGNHYILKHIEPIPLTEEILEKNGFKEITGKVKKLIWAWKGLEKLVEISEVTPCVYQVIIHKEASDLGDERVFVKYVHELQHALKLCGIEKEIII